MIYDSLDMHSFIQSMYPITANADDIASTAILCPKNTDTDEINNIALDTNTENEIILYSADTAHTNTINDNADNNSNDFANDTLSPEFLIKRYNNIWIPVTCIESENRCTINTSKEYNEV